MKKFLNLFVVALMFTTAFALTSCGDNEDPSASVGRVHITNRSTYTLDDFVVNFTNDSGEIITREKKGTVKPGQTINVDVPIGATYYYMGTYFYGKNFWSANYPVSVRTQVLTDQIVEEWKSNS